MNIKSEKLNRTKWNPLLKEDLVESYFMKINCPKEDCAIFIKFTFINSIEGRSSGSVWAIFFDLKNSQNNIAVKENFSPEDIKTSNQNLYLKLGNNFLSCGFSRGKLNISGNIVEWAFTFDTNTPSLTHFPYEVMYHTKFPKNKISSPFVDTTFSGYFTINGREIIFDNSKGMQGHNFGESNSNNWVWTHCNSFDGEENVVFEAISSKLNIQNISTPPLTILYLNYKGKEIFLNSIPDFLMNKSETDTLKWKFKGFNHEYEIEGEFWGLPSEFVALTYHNPDKSKVYCINSMACFCKIVLKRKFFGFSKIIAELKASNTAALEIGSRHNLMGVELKV